MKKLVNILITTFVVMLMSVLTSVEAKASTGWTVNPADFRYDMSLYFEVAREDGASIDYNLYDVGAFVDGQCRGLSEVVSLPGGGSCLYMRIRSNQESGEWVSFKLREKATQAVTDIENVTVAFKSDDRIGMPSDPFRMVVGAKDSYTVTISAGIGGSVDNVGGQYDEGATLTVTATPDEGYSFAGWSDGNNDATRIITVSGDISLTANFTVNSYKLTYVVDGETYKDLTVEYGTKLTAEAAPTKEGYTFSGWEGLPETMPARDVTVTGSFTVNSYKLTYVVDGETYKEQTVEYGTKLTAEAAPTKEGYTFGGWEGLPETMPARDVTVTAVYDVNYYWLRTYVNDRLVYEEEIAYGAKVIVPDPEIGEGYTFNGWAEDVPDVMPAHDVELHALVSVVIDSINSDGADETVDVYSIEGQLILHAVAKSQLRNRLAPGLYIISGRKILIK